MTMPKARFRHEVLNERTLDGRFRALPELPLAVGDILREAKSSRTAPNERFQRLFLCYRQPSSLDLAAMHLIQDPLAKGRLSVDAEFVNVAPPIGEPFSGRWSGTSRPQESAEHEAMKTWAQRFLEARSIASACEVSRLGYHVDVGSFVEGVFVECGDTEPAKVLAFLRHGLPIGVLQYDSEDIVWFRPSPEFQDWCRGREAELWGLPDDRVRQD